MPNLSGFFSLGRGVNTSKDIEEEIKEGKKGPLLDEAALSMSDKDLLETKKGWEKKWKEYEPDLKRKQEECEKYYLGEHFSAVEHSGAGTSDRPMVDNAIYEALETFLPVATKRNPEPQTASDDTPEGKTLSDRVNRMLIYHADRLRMKLKLKRMTRYWALYFLGVAKIGWSQQENDLTFNVIRTQKIILDPDATIEEGEYTGEYIGHVKQDTAANLVRRFPNKSKEIKDKVKDKMGTMIGYTEWWTTSNLLFWTMESEVLGKAKNPHWNEPTKQENVAEDGSIEEVETPGMNHFAAPKMPFIFLSIFNVGLHPHDDTSLIYQNLANQDLINKRKRQIDRNADNANGGVVVSGDHFTKEEASQVSNNLRKGGTIWVPSGDVNVAIKRDPASTLPSFVYQDLVDSRQRLLDIFGVRGTTPSGLLSEPTVRGKIINRGSDESRIGGGISEFIEQVSDQIFNWFVQMMYVYYDETHTVAILGDQQAQQFISLRNTDFTKKLTVSVKEGSLIPKDDLTERNEAVDLWSAGALSPIDLFDKLQFANPLEMAKRLFLWQNFPQALFDGSTPEQGIQQLAVQQAQSQALEQAQQGQQLQQGQQQIEQNNLLASQPLQT